MTRARPLLALLLAALALFAPSFASAKPGGAEPPVAPDALDAPDFSVPDIAVGERILSYRSDVDVGADGTLHVAETIQVNAEGDEIRHGIYRDFPTIYPRGNRRIRVGFDVEAVERDGQAEHYALEHVGNGVRVRIGNADAVIAEGRHTYVIRYRTTRQIGFFDGYDELYWNVTGTGWIFPIDRVEVHIRLPQAADFSEPSIYTGAEGTRDEHDGEVVSQRPGEIVFRSTRVLQAHEGITVAARWQKGVVAAITHRPAPPSWH